MPQQLPLTLAFPEELTFDSFLSEEKTYIQSSLEQLVGSEHICVFIYGGIGTGKSHLCQSFYHHLNAQGYVPAYIDCTESGIEPDILDSLESFPVVILDGIELLLSDELWQEKLFHLYNRLLALKHHLVIASSKLPEQYSQILPDLESRLMSGLLFQLSELPDDKKITALQNRALAYGLDLPIEVGQYILGRLPRDMHGLFATLKQLDIASLQYKRRLTIPFVKEVLSL